MTDTASSEQAKTLETMRKLYKALQHEKRARQDLEQQLTGPIAIVGMGCRFPGGSNTPHQFWNNLLAGHDAITDVPSVRWDQTDPRLKAGDEALLVTQNGGFIDDPLTAFDYDFFRLSPKEARSLDPQQRLLLEISWEALEDAGVIPSRLAGSRTGVFIGLSGDDYMLAERHQSDLSQIGPYSITGTTPSTAAGRLAYFYGLEGPALPVDTACSSALTALHLTCHSLNSGETDMALSGGVNLILAPHVHACFSQLQAIAPDGRCKTFDAAANGYARAEGCGLLVLKRLPDAQSAGDRILGVIDATVINQDGASNGFTAPNGAAQRRLLLEGLAKARLTADDIDYVETHGTGTALGDPIEAEALSAVFGAERGSPLILGTLKSQIGHLEAAAGVASVIKTVLAMRHGQVPPNLHFNSLNPLIDWDPAAVTLPVASHPWPNTATRRAGVSAFGFSGTNAHVILSQAPESTALPETVDQGPHTLVLSAVSAAALATRKADMAEWLGRLGDDPAQLRDICATLLHHRTYFTHRFVCEGATVQKLIAALRADQAAVSEPAMNWVAGQDLDASLHHAPNSYQIADLPTHVFDRKPCRLGPEDGPIIPVMQTVTSPALPAFMVQNASNHWAIDLAHRDLRYLQDHEVLGTPVMPAAGYLACTTLLPPFAQFETLQITDVNFLAPLVLQGGARWLDVKTKATEEGYHVNFATQTVVCTLTAHGGGTLEPVTVDTSGGTALGTDALFSQHGDALTLGPAFRLADQLQSSGTAIAGKVLPDVPRAGVSIGQFDVALQMAAHVLPQSDGIGLPTGIARVQINLAAVRAGLAPDTANAERDEAAAVASLSAGATQIAVLQQITGGSTTAQALHVAFDAAQQISFAKMTWEMAEAAPVNIDEMSTAYVVPNGTMELPIWDGGPVEHLIYVDAAWPADTPLADRLTPLITLAQDVLGRAQCPTLSVITAGAFDPLEQGHALCPAACGVWGFVRALWQEEPRLRGALTDLDPVLWTSQIALATASAGQYARRDDALWTPVLTPCAFPEPVAPRDGVTVITGGMGALGRALAEAEQGPVVVIGRSAAQTTLADNFTQIIGDVNDAATWEQIKDPVAKIYHFAGVSGAGLIAASDPAQIDAHLAAKTVGTTHAIAKAQEHGARLVLAASLAGHMGAAGQSLYAAANMMLEGLAAAADVDATVVALGPLNAGLAAGADVQAHLASQGLLAAPLRLLHRAVQADVPWLAAFQADAAHLPTHPPFQAFAAPTLDVSEDLPELITNQARKALGLAADDPLDPDQNLFALGLDSLMALQIRNAAEAALDVALPGTLVFDHPSVAGIVAAISDATDNAVPIDVSTEPISGGPPVLSSAQESLWFRQQINPKSAAFHTLFSAELASDLTVAALQTAFRECLERHDSLRMHVRAHPDTGLPEREEGTADAFIVTEAVLTGDDPRAELRQISQQPFDLAHELPIRAQLFTALDQRQFLLITAHHICIDVWSFELLLKDLGDVLTGVTAPAAPSYQAYVHHQTVLRDSESGQCQQAFWQNQLGDAPAPALPPLATTPVEPSRMEGATEHVMLPADMAKQIEAYARENGVTLYALLTAVWGMVCQRFDPDTYGDVIIGAPSHGRTNRQWSETLGFFVSVLPLRLQIDPTLAVGDLLQATNQRLSAAMAHQDLPFQDIVATAPSVARSGDYPLFNTVVHMRQLDGYGDAAGFFVPDTNGDMQLGPLALKPFFVDQQEGQYPLVLEWSKADKELWLSLTYDIAYYDSAAIKSLRDLYTQALDALVDAAVTEPLARVDLLPPPDLSTPMDTGMRPYLIDAVIADNAVAHPDRDAVVWWDGVLSYADLDALSNGVAHRLAALGVGPGDRVGVCMDRSPQMLTTLLGILKLGAAYVPLVKDLPSEALLHQMGQADLRALVHDPDAPQPVVEAATAHLMLSSHHDIAGEPLGPDVPRAVTDIIYVLFTSGSTGVPKGVQVGHDAFSLRMKSLEQAGIHSGPERFLVSTTFGFDPSVTELFYGLISGGQAIIAPPGDERDPRALIACIRDGAVTATCSVPSMIRQVLAAPEAATDLQSLRVWYCGGEPMPFEMVQAFQALRLPAQLVNVYGPTEATFCGTYWPVHHDLPVTRDGIRIGRTLPGDRFHLLDDDLRPVPFGATGQIYMAGPCLMAGYFNDPEKTKSSLVPAPDGGLMYRTGDYAAWVPEANEPPQLRFLGRGDFQVKVNGVRVELGDIEARLRDPSEPLELCARVMTAPSGASQIVVAYAASVENADHVVKTLRRRAAQTLQHALQPRRYVRMDRIPLLHNGKRDLGAVDALFAQPADGVGEADVATGGPVSEILQVWADVLQVPEVGLDQNFFELGGSSLLLAQVRNGLEKRGLTGLHIKDLFRHTTVRALAGFLDDAKPPTPAVHDTVMRRLSEEGIAVVGMVIRAPGAADLEAYWDLLRKRDSGLSRWSRDALTAAGVPAHLADDPAYVPVNGALADIDQFDARFFGFSPAEAEQMDPQHRLFLQAAWHTLEHAGYANPAASQRIGVYAGSELSNYLLFNLAHRLDPNEMGGGYALSLANDKDSLATRVAYACNLRGPAITVQTACSTSLTAVAQACEALMAGKCEMALAGGVSINLPQDRGYLHKLGMVASRDGTCRPFDTKASGTVNGNGLGLVLLKPLAQSRADGDTIHGVLRGWGINNDGSGKVGYTAPSEVAQADAIGQAWQMAGVRAGDLRYVETHGTGTINGDPIEISGLELAHSRLPGQATEPVWLGAVKANIGHLGTASGIAGLIKTVLVTQHKTVPPLRGFVEANAQIDLAGSVFAVPKREVVLSGDAPVVAGVSSFGIGGTNVHVVVEGEHQADRSDPENPVVLPISAQSPQGVHEQANALAAFLETQTTSLGDVAFTLQNGRAGLAYRDVIVAVDRAAAIAALRAVQPRRTDDQPHAAAVLPGQGSQFPQMCRTLYERDLAFRADFDQRLQSLASVSGTSIQLWEAMIFGTDPQAQADLAETANTQPVLYVVQTALLQMWSNARVQFDTLVGHSIGEYAAACVAGVFSFEDGLRLVVARGQLIQSMPKGSMLAVAMPAAELLPLLPDGADLAGDNGPTQSVVSAPDGVIDPLAEMLSAQGITVHKLDTSHAFHSAMMEPILDRFRETVAGVPLRAPARTVVSCLTGAVLTATQATDPDYWVQQLRGTVQFRKAIETVCDRKPTHIVEIGPGQSLSGQLKRLSAGREIAVLGTCAPKGQTLSDTDVIAATGGVLWSAGHRVAWPDFVRSDTEVGRVPLPLTVFETERYWIDPQPVVQVASGAPQRFVSHWVPSGLPGGPTPKVGQVICLGKPDLLAETDAIVVDDLNDVQITEQTLVILSVPSLMTLIAAARHVAQTPGARMMVLTKGAVAVGLEPPSAEAAMLSGAAAGIRRECHGFDVRVIDVEQSIAMTTLLAELGQDQALVAYRGARRFVRRWHRSQADGPRICANGMHVVVTGGLGGLGRACATRLIAEWHAQVTVIGRRALADIPSAARDWLAQNDSNLRYVQANITDQARLSAVLTQPVDLLLHCAGHVENRALADVTAASVERVLDPKCAGAQALSAVLDARLTVYFSSLSAVTGANKAVDYAAANAYLDAYATAQSNTGRETISIGWDGWYETGMAADAGLVVSDSVRSRALGTQEAVNALMDALTSGGSSHVLISKTNFDGYTETVQKAVRSDDQPDAGPQHRRPDLVSIYAPPQSDAEHNLASIWSDVLGIAKIGIDDNFFDIGGDSLIGAEVLNRINTAFGKQLPAVAIFDAPNIRSMAALLGEKVAASETDTDASPAKRRRRPRRRQLKDEL